MQRDEALRRIPTPQEDEWIRAKSVIDPLIDPQTASVREARDHSVQPGMLTVDGGHFTFTLQHMRRECGCYPDPGTPADKWDTFLIGTPHDQPLEHHVTADVASCQIAAAPVTNEQFETFLRDSGYRPQNSGQFPAALGRCCMPRGPA